MHCKLENYVLAVVRLVAKHYKELVMDWVVIAASFIFAWTVGLVFLAILSIGLEITSEEVDREFS